MINTLVQNLPYWLDGSASVIVFLDSHGDVLFARTTDRGISWGDTELIDG